MIFPLNPRASYANVYTISPCICVMYPSFLSCFLCVRTFYSISPLFVYLCIHAFTLFHHIAMFMYPSYLHYFTILYVMCPSFLSCFLCVRTFYSISHTFFVYLCVHAFTLFHHIAMFMCPSYLHYFTILICYVSKLFILFPMCQDFLLYFTISFMYVYVSKLFILFLMCQNFLLYFTILFVCYVSKLFILFPMCQDFLLYFTILLCVYVSMFLYYFTIYINHICYVSILLTLFHHITFFTCYVSIYTCFRI